MTLLPSFHISVTEDPPNDVSVPSSHYSKDRRTEGLSGVDNAGEADLDVLDLAERLDDVLSSDAERAETVQD